jgi:beta-lactam-binding protein with PASTA domain
LLISAALDPPAFVMPSFGGQPLGSVSRVLLDSGFKLGNVTITTVAAANPPGSTQGIAPVSPAATPPQPSPASLVVSQTPAAGQKVLAGTTVSFEVR